MSLSKEKSNKDNYRRDSFSDRVCDDLSEVILQYLSLKDKLRLECVSKQFQRTALITQKSLDFEMFSKIREDFEAVKQLFKKFPNLSQISTTFLRSHNTWPQISKQNDLIELIIKYCNHLTRIQFGFIRINGEEVERRFFDKFGLQLISLRFDNWFENIFFSLTKAPNIEELIIHSFDSQLSQIKFNRLKKFNVFLIKKDLNSFELFIENNAKTLKHLDINFYDNEKTDSFEYLLKIITKSINLVHLSFDLNGNFNESLTDYWKEIANNCKQIKSFKLYQRDYNKELFSILKQLKRLKRLDLFYRIINDFNKTFHPFQDLKDVKGLTHLGILFNTYGENSNETFLTDIDINFPKLQSLNIYSEFNASEWTAQVLSRLSSLETIWLSVTNPQITHHIKRQLIKSCRKFKKFTNPYK